MEKSILIFGSHGYLGTRFSEYFQNKGWKVIPGAVDISDYTSVVTELQKHTPFVVLNAAGKTGKPNVDWCEEHKVETMSSNVTGAVNLASACQTLGLYLVHLGSGCIYEGDNYGKGFTEEDEPNFYGSFYSRTKLYSEKLLKEFDNVLQLRIRIPIEAKSNPKNVIDKLLKYEKVISVDNSFTVVPDLLPATEALIEKGARGIFNMTNPGYMNHEYLMTSYTKIVDPSRTFAYMLLDEMYDKYAKAKRSNCVLNTQKRETFGVPMPPIRERVLEILEEYKKNKAFSVTEQAEAIPV